MSRNFYSKRELFFRVDNLFSVSKNFYSSPEFFFRAKKFLFESISFFSSWEIFIRVEIFCSVREAFFLVEKIDEFLLESRNFSRVEDFFSRVEKCNRVQNFYPACFALISFFTCSCLNMAAGRALRSREIISQLVGGIDQLSNALDAEETSFAMDSRRKLNETTEEEVMRVFSRSTPTQHPLLYFIDFPSRLLFLNGIKYVLVRYSCSIEGRICFQF